MESLTVQQIIKKLNNQEISIIDIPSEFRHHKKVLEEERKLGLRIEHNRGFDVVHNCFFVEEEIHYTNRLGELSKKAIILLSNPLKNTIIILMETFTKMPVINIGILKIKRNLLKKKRLIQIDFSKKTLFYQKQ